MKHFKLLALLVMAFCFCSCTTIEKTTQTVDVNAYIVQYPTVADLEISPKKVSRTTAWSSLFSLTRFDTRKENCIAELLQECDADVLVEEHMVYKKEMFGTNKLTVFGFPAKYKNFRKATDADLEALKLGRRDITVVSDPYCGAPQCAPKAKKDKKKKKFSLKGFFR